MQFRNTLAVVAAIVAMGATCAVYGVNLDQDLATPESTVLAYCNSGVFDLGSKYFHFPKDRGVSSDSEPLNWKACKIISTRKTNLVGTVADGQKVRDSDVEVVLQVLEPNSNGAKVSNKYWFLVRDFGGNWKIISYSVISNDIT